MWNQAANVFERIHEYSLDNGVFGERLYGYEKSHA